jgi:hypothetical protein
VAATAGVAASSGDCGVDGPRAASALGGPVALAAVVPKALSVFGDSVLEALFEFADPVVESLAELAASFGVASTSCTAAVVSGAGVATTDSTRGGAGGCRRAS